MCRAPERDQASFSEEYRSPLQLRAGRPGVEDVPPIISLSLFRQTLRRLIRERGFTLTILLTLGLCIGANVAIFAVVDAIVVRPLPFPQSERLVTVMNSYPGAGAERSGASTPNYFDRRGNIAAFASTSLWRSGSATVGEAGAPRRVARDRVTPEFFDTLGVRLVQGRAFTEDEMTYDNARVVVITDEFWQSQFNRASDVIGRAFTVDGLTHTVVGLLPAGFRFLESEARFFTPYASGPEDRAINRRHSNNSTMIVRLAPGVSLTEAQAQMDAFTAGQLQDDPFAELLRNAGYRTLVYSLHDDTVREIKPVLLLLQAGVLALLLIGAVNLANLMLIRANGRAKEFAVRQALGGSRRLLASEITFESVLLAVGGGIVGLGLGALGIRLLAVLGTDRLPLGVNVVFDARVAVVALAGAAICGLVLALPVMAFSLRRNLGPDLQAETRGGTASRAAQRLRHGFIVTQVALAFVLLSGAGLLGLSLRNVLQTSPGFQADHVLTGRISLPWSAYKEDADKQAFYERLVAALRNQPGVMSAAVIDGLPFGGNVNNNATTVEGAEPAPGESIRTHFCSTVMGEYWQSLGIPLIAGRYLEDGDNARDQRVCVVDQAFVDRYWPGQNALGRRLATDVEITDENAVTIVGVVGTVKQQDLTDAEPLGAIYFPFKHNEIASASIVLRTALAPESQGAMLQKLVLSLDPSLPVDDIKVLQNRIDDSLVGRRSPAMLAGIFAAIALVLAALGTYGVLAYAVSQRRREIGVRMALGAQPTQIRRQFLGLGARLLGLGVALGVGGAYLAGRAMQSQLFNVPPFDARVLAVTAAVMMAVVLVSTLLPSHRASRVNPLDALRDD